MCVCVLCCVCVCVCVCVRVCVCVCWALCVCVCGRCCCVWRAFEDGAARLMQPRLNAPSQKARRLRDCIRARRTKPWMESRFESRPCPTTRSAGCIPHGPWSQYLHIPAAPAAALTNSTTIPFGETGKQLSDVCCVLCVVCRVVCGVCVVLCASCALCASVRCVCSVCLLCLVCLSGWGFKQCY